MADDQLSIVKEEPLRIVGMSQSQESAPQSKSWTAAIPIAVSGAAAALPAIRDAAGAIGTSTTAAQAASKGLNLATQAAMTLKGLSSMNPLDMIAAPGVGYRAGNAAYWLTRNFAQPVARQIFTTLDAVAPYAKSLITLGATMGGAAVPMGVDLDSLSQSPEQQAKNPAPLRMLVTKVEEGVKSLMGYGLSREQAVKAIKEHVSEK